MATVYEIPLDSLNASVKIRTVLEDIELVLRFDWNERLERWVLYIYDAEENPLVLGLVLNINQELIRRFEIEGLPPGNLILYDAEGTETECGRDDLGDRCKLLYQDSE